MARWIDGCQYNDTMPEDPDDGCHPGPTGGLPPERADSLAATFAALGDPVRLRIYSLILAGGEICSCHLEGPVGKSQPTISHHTSKLAEAGLIVGEKRGRWTWWRAAPGRLPESLAALGLPRATGR
jgi:ArsR family transcriptional regulator